MFIDFITKVSDIIADFSHGHFELQNFILAQKMMFITPSTFIIEMRVLTFKTKNAT